MDHYLSLLDCEPRQLVKHVQRMKLRKALITMVLVCSVCVIVYYFPISHQNTYRTLLENPESPAPRANIGNPTTTPEKLQTKKEGKKLVSPQFNGSVPDSSSASVSVSAPFRKAIPKNTAFWNRILHTRLRQMDQGLYTTGLGGLDWSHCRKNVQQLHANINDLKSYPELHQAFLKGMDCRDPPILIDQPEKCTSDGGGTFLLFAIKSTPRNFERRQMVRETWGQEKVYSGGVRVRTVFLLGSSSQDEPNLSRLLASEGDAYGDILQWDFQDSFFNLTLKEHVFYRWAMKHCPNISFVFKGDDDVFANTEPILSYLQSLKPDQASKLYLGQVISTASPLRDPKSKYYIPHSFYEGPYPEYAGGGGYVFSGMLIGQLYSISLLLPFYPIDDVYTGMCFSALGIYPEKHNAFQTFDIQEQDRENVCVHKDLLLVHKREPQQVIRMWKSIKNPLLIC